MNLQKENGRLLPEVSLTQHGQVCEILKSGEVVTCEVHSSDLWLQVKVQCPAARLEISFEVKVSRSSLIQPLRLGLFDYVVHLLSDQGLEKDFQPRDLQLNRVIAGKQRSEERLLEDDTLISDCFTFDNCLVVGTLEKGGICPSPLVERSEDSSVRQPEEIIRKTLSVRKIQTRALDVPREHKPSRGPALVDRKCQGCLLC